MKLDNGVVPKWGLRWAVTPAELVVLQEPMGFGSHFGSVGCDSDIVVMDYRYSPIAV